MIPPTLFLCTVDREPKARFFGLFSGSIGKMKKSEMVLKTTKTKAESDIPPWVGGSHEYQSKLHKES